jgi:hypothetical protein
MYSYILNLLSTLILALFALKPPAYIGRSPKENLSLNSKREEETTTRSITQLTKSIESTSASIMVKNLD